MRAIIRGLHSPDVHDLREYIPAEPDSFSFLLQILAGPDNGPGEESFDVIVCTPNWLMRKYAPEDVVPGTHMLIVFRYDYDRLRRFIEARVSAAAGDTWQDVARQLAVLGHWEFENYVPAPQ